MWGCRGLCFVSLGLWCDSFGDFTQLNEGWGLCFLSFLCAVWVWWAGGGFVGSGGGTGLSLWLCGCDSEDNNTFNIIWEKVALLYNSVTFLLLIWSGWFVVLCSALDPLEI